MKHQAQSRFFLDIVVWANVVILQLFANQKSDAVGQAGYPPCLWFGPWHSQWCHWAHSQGHWSCLSRSASLSTRPLTLSYLATSWESLTFAILTIMCLDVDLFGFISYGTLSASLIWIFVPFLRLGRFSAIIFSDSFLALSLFSPPGSPIMQMLFHLILSQRSFKISSLIKISFCYTI